MRGYAVVLGTGVVALGTIRCYAQAGLRVIHLTTKHDDIAGYSRYMDRKCVVPRPDTQPRELLKFLNTLPEWPDAVLDPVNDPGVVFVAQHHDALSRRYRVTVPRWEVLHGIVDKSLLYRRAHELGVPAPLIRKYASVAELDRDAESLTYPCIIKPTQTPDFFAVYNRKVLVAATPEHLRRQYRDVAAHGLDVMVSEIIPGPEEKFTIYICHMNQRQDVLAEMTVQKIRQHPSDFGVGSVIKTIPPISDARASALRLLRDAGYSGFSATEFKWDERDGRYKLIEINTRQVLYAHLFARATINFPDIMYRDKVRNESRFSSDYAPDVHWIHPLEELYEYRARRKITGFSLKEFLAPYRAPCKVFALDVFDDAMPFLRSLSRLAPGTLTKIVGR